MPRPAKGARIWLEPERRNSDGTLRQRSTWVIRDGSSKIGTGCGPSDRAGAEQALAKHIAEKYAPKRERSRSPSEILIADVITIYLTDIAPQHAREDETRQRCVTLLKWWGLKKLSEVNGRACRDYVAWRIQQPRKAAKPETTGKPARPITPSAARRELEDLRSAINHHRREGLCSEIVEVVLPDKPLPRERWLTRSEAARLIWAAWRYREVQKGKETGRRSRRHVARFILVALYTGTRSSAVCGAALEPTVGRGWIDLDSGVFYRRAQGARETKKRQPPVKLPSRLLAHIRRWKDTGVAQSAVVEWNGEPVASVKKAFARTVIDAGLSTDVTPHILRHTCATWLMQARVDLWEAAGFLGMTVQQLEATYGHHHPEFQSEAAEALRRQKSDRNPVNKTERTPEKASKIVDFSRRAG
ncbi:site-specific integrase [Chelatococcus sp.]|uniref:site-specific integrase n=1 Tax=Chelatococcus sp. TaxID=1953771 RepID=UPI001EC9C634|nr:site-specific integrase [Chelatococcus sp.]MBX3546872.1 site-specific integrase [Chelatococcus sp.]